MPDLWLNKLGSLREGESIQGSFPCHLDYIKGVVVLTDQRMIFVQGGGRFNKVYTRGLEADYADIVEVEIDPANRLRIKLKDEKYSHSLETIEDPISQISDLLKNYVRVHYYYEPEIFEEIPA
jgi:hypothetical protein